MTRVAPRPSAQRRDRIAVALLTGYLGSGKTTLLNAVVRQPAWADTAVIVNELGEIGIDHLLIEQATDNVVLLDSGCLCCALQGGLRETLADLFVRRVNGTVPPFRRVVVETTGLADPGPIANALVADALLREEFVLASIVTTIDGLAGARIIDSEWEATRQVALADVLVITKGDLADGPSLGALDQQLATINPLAPRLRAVKGDLPVQTLFPDSYSPAALHLRSSRFAEQAGPVAASILNRGKLMPTQSTHLRGIRSFVFTLPAASSWAGIAAWTNLVAAHFGDQLLRTKGLIEVAEIGRPVAVHGIGRYFHPPEPLAAWPSDDHRSRLVCIGRNLDAAALQASLRAFTLAAGAERPSSLAELLTL